MTNDNLNLLNEAISSGIISLSDVQEKLMMTKKQRALNKHKYNIWEGKTGYWYTYLPCDNNSAKRRQIKRKSKTELEEAIINYYIGDDEQEQYKKVTLKSLYHEWLDYKSLHTNASSSIRRIDCDWTKYYLNDPIIHIPLVQMDSLMLDKWTHKKIKDYEMTRTEYYNMSIILRQSLIYAVDKKILKESPFKNVKINTKLLRKVKKKDDHTQVYLNDEQKLIEQEAWKDFHSDTSCTTPLAVLLDFQTGLRIGELVALKWSDIKGNYVQIRRMEVRQEKLNDDNTWNKADLVLVDHVKTNAGYRKVYLTKEAKHILHEVRKSYMRRGLNSEFIFIDKQEQRIHKYAVDKRIRKYCKYIGISPKSMHKARKTYISTLIDAGVNINTIRSLAGHESEETTYKNYCFDRMVDKQKEDLLERALTHHAR
ncbi:MAG: site-specific integrase [Clostridiales bacterium]|jgi:integrase|nr:site-specific integrase [Clostridiales bacterium]